MLEAESRESVVGLRDKMGLRRCVDGLRVDWESRQARSAVIRHVLRRRGHGRRRRGARLDRRNLLDILLQEGVETQISAEP